MGLVSQSVGLSACVSLVCQCGIIAMVTMLLWSCCHGYSFVSVRIENVLSWYAFVAMVTVMYNLLLRLVMLWSLYVYRANDKIRLLMLFILFKRGRCGLVGMWVWS